MRRESGTIKRIVGSSVATVLAAIALQPAPTLAEPPEAAIGAWGVDTAGEVEDHTSGR
jgi:hypothetical protein